MRTAESPVFILTTSRSGSTLLRFILDSHPDFACPPESGVAAACSQLARTWANLEQARTGEQPAPAGPPALSPRAAAAVRAAIDEAYGEYLCARGKPRWCEKSLETYRYSEVLAQIYPDAKFILLTRHCMDVIASGVEMCPWGLNHFGFDAYAMRYPGNSVAAIGSYWLACTQANLAFSDRHPGSCWRLRYEDLVTSPEESLTAMFGFLGAEQDPGIVDAAFRMPHESGGPGDGKIWFTRAIRNDSVGRGVAVPAAALPDSLRQPINQTLARLGYRTIGDDWNVGPGQVDPRADATAPSVSVAASSVAASCVAASAGGATDEVQAALGAIGTRIGSRTPADLAGITSRWPALADVAIRFVVQGADGSSAQLEAGFMAAVPAPPATPTVGDHGNVLTVTARPGVWTSLLDDRANMVTEITSGRMRWSGPGPAYALRYDDVHAVAALLGLPTVPTTHTQLGAADHPA